MSKSIYKLCIRRWKVRAKHWTTPHWPEPFKSKYIRNYGLITAQNLINEEGFSLAIKEANESGWSQGLSKYIDENRSRLTSQAILNLRNITTEEIDDAIESEIDCWGE